ncbi:MAG TPA: adenine deaminase C-terminal domain-containing protein [Tetragenococcus sp.]|nr:adenine deaminase C-terminal domain-containing protein [Tetragenococcus sp.]
MKVDLLIKQAHVYQTPTQNFAKKNVAIKAGKFYYIADEDMSVMVADKVIEAQGKYMIPGMIDCHMHIESSMTTPSIFSEVVKRYGVTTVIADAHEIANVAGIKGMQEFMSNDETLLDIFYAIPSSVPSTAPALETTGGIIGLAEVKALLTDPRIICLGEAMNYYGIAYDKESLIRQIIDLCKKTRPTMPLEGHIPKIYDYELADFLFSGITSDHTQQFADHILEKIQAGLFIQFQKKSISPENMAIINDHDLYDYACFITDDVMADDLLTGHLNENVKLAIQCGMPVEKAIYMATYTPARRMSLNDRGMIAPGRLADFSLVNDLKELAIDSVYKKGKLVFQKGDTISYPQEKEKFSSELYQSVHCRKLSSADLTIAVDTPNNSVRCHAIQKQKVGTFTKAITKEVAVEKGVLQLEKSQLAQLLVMERYGKNGNIGRALIDQPLKKKGAIATTWAHDHHNLMVMGNDEQSILIAQHYLLEIQGGYVVVKEGKVIASCPLPIGGILSQEKLEVLGKDLKQVRAAMQALGYENTNEIMSFSTLSLPVSPAIKVTDFGMMNTKDQVFYPLVFPEDGKVLN